MIAKLMIETAWRNNKTLLQYCFCTPPFKVLDITEDRQDPVLHLMLMTASPGILDGDVYNLNISIAAGCSLQLHTQSYQRLFQMKHGALQHLEIRMEQDSTFCYLPHPSVPHQASQFTTKSKIVLSGNCTLIWGEIITCGRASNGEQFHFSKYHSLTEIFLQERLIIKENLLLEPAFMDVRGIGQLEGYTHQASLIYLDAEASLQALLERLHDMLLPEAHICFGITLLPVNGIIIRILGYKGEQLYGLLKKLARLLIAKPERASEENIKADVYAN